MCSVLVFTKPDNDHPDKNLDHEKFKAGAIVDVHDEDDFFWGSAIQGLEALGWWEVVIMKGVSGDKMRGYARAQVPDIKSLNSVSRVRAVVFDVEKLKAAKTLADIAAAATLTPIFSPPIGLPSNVIG